jgi:PAS domain S-box-containing protein
MDNISTVISSIQQEENFLLVTRKQANQQNINNSSRVISLSQVIIVILLLAAFTVIYNNIRIRNKTEKEIKNLNEMLELKAEEKTREVIEKEKQYRFLLENMHEGIQVIGFDWRYLFVNSSVVQQSMYSNKELLGYTLMENYPGIENTELFRVLRRCMKERTSQIFENEFTSPNGTKGWFELSIQPVPEGLFILTMDITERKKAEQARKESELFISSVLASLKSQIAVIDESGAIITVNKAWDDFAKENGVTSLERTGKGSNYFDVCKKAAAEGDEIAAQCLKGILLVLKKEIKSFELEYPCHSPNKQRWFMLGVTNFEGDTPRVVIVHQDITARVLAEKKTEEQKTLSEGLLESAPDGIVGINEKGEIIIFNKQAENLFGYQRNEMIGEPLEKLMPVKFQETHKSNIQDYFKMPGTRQMGSRKKELFGVRKNGEQFPVDISLSVLLTANEKIAIAAIRDVTENKEITAKLLDKTIALEKSNIELERYAHVASHDLQEPLRMVSSFLQLLENKLEGSLDETNKKYIYFAVDGAERMRKLIQDLLQYSSVGTNKEEFTVTDLNDVMQYVTRVLNEKIKEGQALIMVKPLPVIMANKTLINEVFLNLVSNALKYRGEKNPEIEVGYTEEANSWKFYVKDNGIGIDPKYFEKIFVIFQRLHNKTEYSGTGIGLAICKKIVETHGGKIWVESELEKGSVFYFTIKK